MGNIIKTEEVINIDVANNPDNNVDSSDDVKHTNEQFTNERSTSRESTSKRKPKVSIILLNWDGEIFLEECINSVYNQTYQNFELIFVDNGSKDNSVDLVKNKYPHLTMIVNDKNEGFGKGNNMGMQVAKGDYIVLLNNDVYLFKDWLEILVKTAEKNKDAAVIGSLNLNYGTNICQSWGNNINFFNNILYFNRYVGRGKDISDPIFKENRVVDYVLGCSMLIKREVLNKVGLIDEIYTPAYHEELDWQYRMGLAGYKIITSPAKLWHHGGQATKESWQRVYLIQRNKLVFIRMRMSPMLKYWNLIISQPIHFLLMLGKAVIKKDFKVNLKGIYEAIKWNFKHKKLRPQIPQLTKVD